MRKNANKFYRSLETDDIDFLVNDYSGFLKYFSINLEPPALKPKFMKFLITNSSSSSKQLRLKSYSVENLEYIHLQDPLRLLPLVSRLKKKLTIELVFFIDQNLMSCPPKISEAIEELISQILTANDFELIHSKLRETLVSIENLISDILKEIKYHNDGFFKNSENSASMASPTSFLTSPEMNESSPEIAKSAENKLEKRLILSPEIVKRTPTPFIRRHLKASLKALKKLKFLLSKLGHLIHWKGFFKIDHQKLKTQDNFKKPTRFFDFMNNRSMLYMKELTKAHRISHFLALNPDSLEPKAIIKYFSWRLSRWKKEKPLGKMSLQNKDLANHEMICKICLKPVEIQKMTLHSENCMKQSELLRQLEILKPYFQRYFIKSTRNARYNEKLYGIERKRKNNVVNSATKNPLKKKSSLKTYKSVKNLRKSLKLKIFEDEKEDGQASPNGLFDKMAGFQVDSPFAAKNSKVSEENLKKIYRLIKLWDLIAKTSSFFLHEDLDQSKKKQLIFRIITNKICIFHRKHVEIKRSQTFFRESSG